MIVGINFVLQKNQIVKEDSGPKDKWIVRYLLISSATHLSELAARTMSKKWIHNI